MLALAAGYGAYVRRLVPIGLGRAAALAIALFYVTPLLPALDWGGILNANQVNDLVVVAGHTAAYWQTWGYFASAIGLGLTPWFMLRLERCWRFPVRRSRSLTGLPGQLRCFAC